MVYGIVINGSEFSLMAVRQLFLALSKAPEKDIFVIVLRRDESREIIKTRMDRIKKDAERKGIKTKFKIIESSSIENDAEIICESFSREKVRGVFIPETMPYLFKEIEACVRKHEKKYGIVVELLSMRILPFVYELMTESIEMILPETTLKEAAEIMVRERIGSLIVAEKGEVKGIITEHDFVRNALSNGDTNEIMAMQIMSSPVITISKYASVLDACLLLMKHKIKKLLVIDENNKPCGIITTTDLQKVPFEIFENLRYAISHY